MQITIRKSKDRGHADYGWLNTYHTFSFANYYDPNYLEFGCLRVLNEDRIEPDSGFPSHPHSSYNIFSYIVDGELTHKDSMGNSEIIKSGNIQFTNAGTGIVHSEFNLSKKKECHFIQIWTKPNKKGLKPSYATLELKEEEKKGKLCEMITPTEKKDKIQINSNVTVYSSILTKDEKVKHKVEKGHKVYIHLIQRKGASISVYSKNLEEGDGCYVISKDEGELEIIGIGEKSEFLLFDLFE